MEKTKKVEIKVMDAYEFELALLNNQAMYEDYVCEDYTKDLENEDKAMTAIFEANSGDPDKLRMEIDGELDSVNWFDYDFEGIKYIVIIMDGEQLENLEAIKQMLLDFFADNFRGKFSQLSHCRTWEHYEKQDKIIAYRGGVGYAYSLWVYNG